MTAIFQPVIFLHFNSLRCVISIGYSGFDSFGVYLINAVKSLGHSAVSSIPISVFVVCYGLYKQ